MDHERMSILAQFAAVDWRGKIGLAVYYVVAFTVLYYAVRWVADAVLAALK
jgi:hypothetical protein